MSLFRKAVLVNSSAFVCLGLGVVQAVLFSRVLERHEVPVVSFHTYPDVGSVDEVKEITGLSPSF